MYCDYFGLDENPFSITPDPRYLYLSTRHREALAHLLFGIGAGGGFVQLTGEIGMGKTTLCRGLLEQIPENVDVALILNPRVTALELVASICDELHIAYPPETTSLKVLIDALNHYLLDAHAHGRRTVLIIDEAQNLSIEVLEQVRLLTNLETAKQKLLQIILIGQPELKLLLESEALRQLAQRITARYHLSALAVDETGTYVQHRLHVAGMKGALFTPPALRQIHRLSGGIPRLINVICDRAMLGAYAVSKQRISRGMVRKAAREVFSRAHWWRRNKVLRWAAGLAVLVTVAAAAWVYVPWPVEQTVKMPKPAPVAKAISATPVAAARPRTVSKPPVTVQDWLRSAGGQANTEAAAYTALFKAAGLDYEAAAGTPCERAQLLGWRCVTRTGTWNNLRHYDRSAVITLQDAGGNRYWLLATALPEGMAMLRAGSLEERFPISTVDQFWLGEYTLLWQLPPVQPSALRPGLHGTAVRWLRERLDAALGPGEAPPDALTFDEGLRARVIAFQQSRGLEGDGIVGTQTLIELSLAVPEKTVQSPTPQ
jgi:general secretion pathway protein A